MDKALAYRARDPGLNRQMQSPVINKNSFLKAAYQLRAMACLGYGNWWIGERATSYLFSHPLVSHVRIVYPIPADELRWIAAS